MTAATLRRAVEDAGGVLCHSDGELVVKTPAGTLTPALISALREYKAELLKLLEAETVETRRRAENALLPV